MSDKLLFISVFNNGAIEIAKNHLQSLRNVGITNNRCYVTDTESYEIIKSLGYKVYLLQNNDIKKDSTQFGTPEFNNMSYVRYYVMKQLLEKGFDVWYMDVDTVVLQDLTPIYLENKRNKYFDVMCQSDVNMPCSGCMLLFSCERTIQFVDAVITNQNSEANDQLIVNRILNVNVDLIRYANFSVFMFPNGLLYFDDDIVKCPDIYRNIKDTFISKKDKIIHFVHANWIIGDKNKIEALKKTGLWFI